MVAMRKRLDRLTDRALDAATCSLRTLADETGLHYVTLSRWRAGTRGVGADSALVLATVIRERAERMRRVAGQLEAAARSKQKGA